MNTCKACYNENIDTATFCNNCGAEITVCESKAPASMPILIMTESITRKKIKLNGNCTIGREGDVESEYFANFPHVGRRQCKIIIENGEYKIEWLETTNPTKINGHILKIAIPKIVIRNGDRISLADKDFIISINKENIQNDDSQKTAEDNPAEYVKIIGYFITCPICGKKYPVSDVNERINECEDDHDDFDRKEISKIRARAVYAD